MNIIFFGNSKYSILGLRLINTTYPLSLIITNPGSPVSKTGHDLNIHVLETGTLNDLVIKEISDKNPDFLIVEDYGLILPEKLLALPKYAPLNIHHSLLPKYRGPSPAPTAILNGDKISGVTIIEMGEKVDSGDILAQKEYKLSEDETTDSLLTRLNTLGGKLITSVLGQYLNNTVSKTKQDPKKATFTKKIKKEDGYFDISNPPNPEKADQMIRAYYPWPNVWTLWPQSGSQTTSGRPKVVKFYPKGLMQMEGKKVMPVKDFLNGYPNFPQLTNIIKTV